MRIPLDRRATKPVYLQIRDRLSGLIQSGALQPGDRLPSIRTLAESTQVNKLTVLEAYSVLEADGLIQARQGSGYFVKGQSFPSPQIKSTFAPEQEVIIPQQRINSFAQLYQASIQVRNQPEIIDFSCGFPLAVDLEDLQRQARRAMKGITDADLFHYDFAQGQVTLRQQIAQMLLQQGLEISPEQLIITNGSMQGLSLYFNYYLQPGDWVIVESPTYHGAIEILDRLRARIIGIPMTADGINLDLLERYLYTHHPKLIYTISTLHNPTGLTTSVAHRQQLLALAEQYNCLILEDNAYEGLNFEPVPAPIKALDRQHIVTYLGTFSKTLMPGLRVGYMVVTGEDYQALVEKKLLHDLQVSSITQAVVSEYLASGHYRRHLNHIRANHLHSRNVMLSALERYFPQNANWTVPQGGLFLWVHLPAAITLSEVCHQALAQKVLVAPGDPFFPGRSSYNAMRLNFSHSLEIIDKGIAILGELLKH